ncbi:hypothetical protein KRX52_15880 [Pseudomonas sp. MAP12]|uniref:Uncharacterized protein n=1 Tax=Geopseudomonas aromaticivorans TaxID=2849492 RepID=A0ABS6MZM2_9GAMM|nr:hypothetical protein [Pseudomonas aromaticivorans]
MEERISGVEDTLAEIDSSTKENLKSNKSHKYHKYPGNIEYSEKAKPKNNRYRRR